jgi:hypothetical protein
MDLSIARSMKRSCRSPTCRCLKILFEFRSYHFQHWIANDHYACNGIIYSFKQFQYVAHVNVQSSVQISLNGNVERSEKWNDTNGKRRFLALESRPALRTRLSSQLSHYFGLSDDTQDIVIKISIHIYRDQSPSRRRAPIAEGLHYVARISPNPNTLLLSNPILYAPCGTTSCRYLSTRTFM